MFIDVEMHTCIGVRATDSPCEQDFKVITACFFDTRV